MCRERERERERGRQAGRQTDKEDCRAQLTEVAGFPFIAFPLTVTLHTIPVWQTPAVMLADVVDAAVVHQVTAVQLKANGRARLHHRDRVQLLSLDHNLLHAPNIPICIWNRWRTVQVLSILPDSIIAPLPLITIMKYKSGRCARFVHSFYFKIS